MNEIHATLDGAPLISLRVTLRRGAAPSTLEAVMPGATPAPGAAVVLAVGDGATLREFRQFRLSRVEDLGDGRVRVSGADAREGWSGLPAHARVNVPGGDGTALQSSSLDLSSALALLFRNAGADFPGGAPSANPGPFLCDGLPLNVAMERACAACGLTFGIDDAGNLAFSPADAGAPQPDPARLIEQAQADAQGAPAAVTGGLALEIERVTSWQAVIPGDGSPQFPEGAICDLGDALAAWGISEPQARRAALAAAGFEKLVPATAPHGARRLEVLRRHAFRMFRATGAALPWIPAGGVNQDGTLAPPRLEAAGARPTGLAPDSAAADGFAAHSLAPLRDGFEVDCERGVVALSHPPYALSSGDATLQSRALAGAPQLRLTIARRSDLPPFRLGEGEAAHAPHLVAVYDGANMLNRAALAAAAQTLLAQGARPRAEFLLAGADGANAVGACAQVEIRADDRGLVTRVRIQPPSPAALAQVDAPAGSTGGAVAPAPSGLHQPINLWRAGPLVLRTSGTAPETESALAAEAVARDGRTSALELAHAGPLAFPFFVDSLDAHKHGRWFFVAGVEAVAEGRVRVLATDARHAPLDAEDLSPVREQRPQGLRGLLVGLGEETQFVDAGPLIADARGREPGKCSNLVADLEGETLSERRRGGLQFLTVLAFSPAHGRWVPALNLRDGDTQHAATCGRGLYAEGDGRALGRLGAHGQGGPMLADAWHCEKHVYGVATEDGAYREAAGHISTQAFFKVPGDERHDAPLAFVTAPFEGRVPNWPPFEAQIKYDEDARHPWNRQSREGLWRIQYRVPFLPAMPPTWTPARPPRPPIEPPPEDPPPGPPHVPSTVLPPQSIEPVVSEHEIWAPSHDWVPLPSYEDTGEELPLLGPSLHSEGWAGEQDGFPNPARGGGAIFLPPGRPLPLAQVDGGTRQTFVTLHPEVLLAFGMPHHEQGRVHSGWQAGLDGADLELTPLNAEAEPGEGTLRVNGDAEVTGKLTVAGMIDPTGLQLDPQAENPGNAATLWADTEGSAMWGAESLALESQIAALQEQIDELRDLIESS